MNKFKPALALLLVFVAGTVFGVVGTRMVVRSVIREVIKHPNLAQERIELNLVKRLKLNPEQKAKVQPIIDQTSPQIQTIRRDAEQKVKTLVDNAMAQIRPILTPEQQKMLDESQHQRRGGRRDGLTNHGSQEEQGD